MRTALLGLAFIGFSLAQNADNGDCSPLQSGTAPTPTPNTPDAFARFEYYDDQAEAAPTPANYQPVFIANNAAIENNTDYLTYSELPSYDVNACAASCDAVNDCVSCALPSPVPLSNSSLPLPPSHLPPSHTIQTPYNTLTRQSTSISCANPQFPPAPTAPTPKPLSSSTALCSALRFPKTKLQTSASSVVLRIKMAIASWSLLGAATVRFFPCLNSDASLRLLMGM